MKKSNVQKPKELLKINIITTILVIISDLLIFFFFESSKDKFTILSTYANGIIFFIYLLLFSSKVKRNILDLKKEALYINYPLNIGAFFIFLFLILIASTICLISVNKDAANITFIFTFFMSTISMLFPSIILLVFIYFAIPAIIIPSISIQKRRKNEINIYFTNLFNWHFPFIKNSRNIEKSKLIKFEEFKFKWWEILIYHISKDMCDEEKIIKYLTNKEEE